MEGPAPLVLVITAPGDATADVVVDKLHERYARAVRTDIADFPQRMRLTAGMTDGHWRGVLKTSEASAELEQIRSVYYRRPTRFEFPPEMSPADTLLAAAEARHGLGGVFAALDAVWVNDPGLSARAEYKPLQLRVAAGVGLRVPPTLVGNDHDTAREFAAAHGPVVCKPLSSVVLGDEAGSPLITYTTEIDVTALDPMQFSVTTNLLQRWVPKAMDCRVTMVGRRPFAAAIRASSRAGHVDWRSDYGALTYASIEVPEEVVSGMTAYLDALGLRFAAFDFGIDHDGAWWFYEANPNGEWLWIEAETGLGISAALADLLIAGDPA